MLERLRPGSWASLLLLFTPPDQGLSRGSVASVADRKAQILDVAKEMFAERGVSQTTVRQIGSQAGILSGSLYHYFESKTDIVDAILSEFCKEVLGNYWRIASRTDGSSADQLRAMARYGFSLITDHSFCRNIMSARSASGVAPSAAVRTM